MSMIYRDDDVSKDTDLKRFKEIHSLFIKYNVLHTVSLICAGIEKNMPLLKYLQQQKKAGTLDIQVHAWDHFDFTTNLPQVVIDLPKCVNAIKNFFAGTPDTLYPPWNKSSPDVEYIAWQNNLRVSNKKISLSQYLRDVKGEVINWHYWADEVNQLEAALKKYTA